MTTNLIKNPNFDDKGENWRVSTWYANNRVEFLSSGGKNGACAKMTVRSTGDPGQSSIEQSVMLKTGTQYTIEFYAKRTSNVDVWVEVSSDAGTQYGPSMRNRLIAGADYTKVDYTFTAKGNSDIANTTIRLIAGSAGGEVWIDSVCMNGEEIASSELVVGKRYLADVSCNSDGVKIREKAPDGAVLGYWPNGRLGVVEAIEDPKWLKCRWKNTEGFIMKKYLTNFRTLNTSSYELLGMVAKQEKENVTLHSLKFYGPNWTDKFYNWCHYFSDWLVGHCAWYDATIPEVANCKDGVIHFLKEDMFCFVNAWHKAEVYKYCNEVKPYMSSGELTEYEKVFEPDCGDYAYFRKDASSSGYNKAETSYHVGIVTHVERYNQGYKVTIAQGNTNGSYNKDSCNIISYIPSPNAQNPELYNDRFDPKILGFGIGLGRG